jgi:hypothetical protein
MRKSVSDVLAFSNNVLGLKSNAGTSHQPLPELQLVVGTISQAMRIMFRKLRVFKKNLYQNSVINGMPAIQFDNDNTTDQTDYFGILM